MTRIARLPAAALVLFSANGIAQSKPIPPATTADFAWLAGSWEGHMVGRPGVVDITFTRPAAGTVAGVMRLVDNDKVLVVELLTIVDAPTGTEMRFRHFSPSLEAYESPFRQSMRLSSHSAGTDVFENAIPYDKAVMSTQPRTTQFFRRGPDEFVGRSDIIDDSGKPAVIEATYRRK
ncbi:MAG: DUF6265 family protein [Gemmatimonadales bacterium]